jgi:LysM repeat protein
MQAVEKKSQWKSRLVISAVAGAHVLAAGTLLMLYGCNTPKGATKVEPPASPIMPPTQAPSPVVEKSVLPPPPPLDLAPVAKEASAAPKTYVVQPGDSISKIAHRTGVSSHEIMELNHIKNANLVRVGQKLQLPGYAKDVPAGKVKESGVAKKSGAKKVSGATAAKKPAGDTAGSYEVKPGDSLEKIAKKNGVKVAALKDANKLTSDKIRVGQKLVIPGKGGEAAPAPAVAPEAGAAPAPAAPDMGAAPAAPAVPPTLLDYTVQDGETVDSIAKTFLVKKDDILKANGATDAAQIRPGMRVKIPVPAQ